VTTTTYNLHSWITPKLNMICHLVPKSSTKSLVGYFCLRLVRKLNLIWNCNEFRDGNNAKTTKLEKDKEKAEKKTEIIRTFYVFTFRTLIKLCSKSTWSLIICFEEYFGCKNTKLVWKGEQGRYRTQEYKICVENATRN
jgi:hypothetical protein